MEIAEVRTRTRTQVDLLQGNVIHALAVFALPFLISNIFQQLYNTVDTIIVGHNMERVGESLRNIRTTLLTPSL